MGIIGQIPPGAQAILDQGAALSDNKRIVIPQSMVEDALANTPRQWTLHGIDTDRSIDISPGHVHYGTAGGAGNIRECEPPKYRESRLIDLYDVTRLIDTLHNIHW